MVTANGSTARRGELNKDRRRITTGKFLDQRFELEQRAGLDETVIFCLTDDMFRVCYWGYFGCRMRRMTARQASPDPH